MSAFPSAVDIGAPPSGWDQFSSDPNMLGWMAGDPVALDRIVSYADGDFFAFPKLRWSVCHFRQLMPTVEITGAPDGASLERSLDPAIGAIRYRTRAGKELSVDGGFDTTYSDGMIVVYRGEVVYERSFGCLDGGREHAAMSMTKSMIGLLAEILASKGLLDETRFVGDIVPELEGSGFGDATVRQVMDMNTAVEFREDYDDPTAQIWAHAAAGNPMRRRDDGAGPRGYRAYLQTVRGNGEHGAGFHYRTVNTDTLAWVVERATGRDLASLLSEHVWRPIEGQGPTYITVDSVGTPFAGGGLSCTAEDLARLGIALAHAGRIGDVQVLPKSAVERIQAGGDRAGFEGAGFVGLRGWSYRSMWWVTHDEYGSFMARGVHGQALYVDPTNHVVIVRFGSHPVAANAAIDPVALPMYRAISDHYSDRDAN